MPPRLRISPCLLSPIRQQNVICRRYASAAAASAVNSRPSVPAAPPRHRASPILATEQPATHRRPEYRKSQLLREYTSLLRTSPLVLLFQHHNLQSTEWSAIRRELMKALAKVDETYAAQGRTEPPLASAIKLQIISTNMFETALRIVDFFRPGVDLPEGVDPSLTHDLSSTVHATVRGKRGKHDFSTILMGPIAVLALPTVSPEYLKAALSILSPKAPAFPAPTRRANPGYHELPVQMGLQKLSLLAARVEGKLFDVEETRWVGGIQGGISGLRAQLVAMLQGIGGGVTSTLEGHSKSLYLTLESRRSVLEEEQKGPEGNNKA